jgi:alkaline phosphatase D
LTSITRRQALAAAMAAAGSAALGAEASGAPARGFPPYRGGRFASGVASGDPGTRSISLWTRLHDVSRPGTLRFEVARDPGFARVVAAGDVRTKAARDHTARVDLRSRALKPGEQYWYRFHTRTADSAVGRFRTLRPPDSREPVRIAVYSCQDYESGFYAAHRGIANEADLDLVVMVGDYIYERAAAGGVREDTTGANKDGDVQSLAEYRQKYRLYHSDPDLQAMHAAHPHLAFWDSHDVEPQGSDSEGKDQYGRPRRVPHTTRLAAGIRSFIENMPQRPHFGDPRRMYRSLPLGATAQLLLTDEQLFHDPYPCAFSFPPPECPAADDPKRTYLGATQKAWLKNALERSRGEWKLYCGGTMMMGFELSRGRAFNTGQWDGFRAEREELMRHILDRKIGNVVRLSGDIHTFFAGQVTTSGRSDGVPAAVEFIGGSISSLGIPEGFSSSAGGSVSPEEVALVTEHARDTNPHIAYTEQRHRGYKVVEARAGELLVDFRAVRDARVRDSEVFTLQRFRVPAGRPVVETL